MIEIEAGRGGQAGLAVLDPWDAGVVRGLFGRLSAESIYRRFFGPLPRPDRWEESLRCIDHRNREAVAAVVGDEVVGVAQYTRKADRAQAELAIVVADGWHRQGLGTRLMAALTERARAAGIAAFAVDIQGDNYAALKLLRRVAPDARLVFSAGVGQGVFGLQPR